MGYGQIAGIDKPIAHLVQGTSIPFIHTRNLAQSFALFDAALAQGCTAFDTAHQYGNGEVERTFGRWLQARGVREQVFILSKCAHHSQDRKRVTSYDISADLMDSLARLQTDYIDLYLLHRDDPSVPVGPIVAVLNEHFTAGRIRAFGGSNWTVERIQQANDYASTNGLVSFAASSVNLSLAEQVREPWRDCISIGGPQGQPVRAWYARTQMPLFAWSSLASGFCSGRFTRDNLDSFTTELDKICVYSYVSTANFARLERAGILAAERGLTMPQVALAYVLNLPLNLFALVGHQNAAEIEMNRVACDIQLSQTEMDWLDLSSDER